MLIDVVVDLRFQGLDLRVEVRDVSGDRVGHGVDDARGLCPIELLLARLDEAGQTAGEALQGPDFRVGWHPRRRRERLTEARDHARIHRIGLGADQLALREALDASRIDDADRVAAIVQRADGTLATRPLD